MIEHCVSFAKVNLFLHVVSKRDDGYHNLYSLMTRIDLSDDLYLDFSSDTIHVSCDHPEVPEDHTNIAFKAARAYLDAVGEKARVRGLGIKIKKKIPPGGGLGGGSSNAATVLNALNAFHGNLMSAATLGGVGLGLGADVPFFIDGRPAIAQGVGERLTFIKRLVPYTMLLCDPGVPASTVQVYKNIDFRLTKKPNYTKSTGLNVPTRGQGFDLRGLLHNDLEEPAFRLYPEIKRTKEEMAVILQRKVHMTGSGSSLFALYSDRKQAQMDYEKLVEQWAGSAKKVFLSSFV